jgi:hypothetical protein
MKRHVGRSLAALGLGWILGFVLAADDRIFAFAKHRRTKSECLVSNIPPGADGPKDK